MKSVDTIARVRREHFIRHRSIREISRDLNVSRNTVRKILRSGATEFQYEREVWTYPEKVEGRLVLGCHFCLESDGRFIAQR
jgi:IS30 family transposase